MIPLVLGAVALVLSEQPVTAAPPVDIPAIARANEKAEDQVRQILADPTSRVGARNRLYYEDPAPPAVATAEAVAAAPYPYSQTFLLHSRPSSSRKIYLDFNGHTIAGTAWNGSYGAPAGSYLAEAFSLDATIDFSTAEQDIIQSVWQRVSEDYAIFDVDVTTQDPGIDAITRSGTADLAYGTRALITDAPEIANNCGCGGIAYLGVFDEPNSHAFYQPAFVFAPSLSDNVKNIAEAVTHEVGHNFDLAHDGTASASYYSGHGSWAPIMGSGYSRPITQWSKGEYTGANNVQNDLAVIPANGGVLLADDYGNTAATATSLGSGPSVSRSGVITTDADVDVFRVDAAAGAATFTARPATVSPNLDILLELRNSAGTLLASNNPLSATVSADVASGLTATISTTLPAAGAYYLWVSGVGAGAAATTGYSGYASVGRYTLTGTVSTGARTVSVSDRAVTEGGAGVFPKASFNVTLSSAAPAAVTVVASTANGTAIAGSDYTAASATLSFPAGTTTLPFSVTVTGDATVEPNETFVVNLTSPSSGLALGDAQGLGTITNDDASGPINNNFAAATVVTGPTGTISGSNVGATKETGEPAHVGNAGGKSVWYRWTAPATGTVSFDTAGSNFDTLLAVYTGTAVNALTPIAANDDTGGGLQSKVTFSVTSGVVYRIAVDGYNGLSGTVKLNWL